MTAVVSPAQDVQGKPDLPFPADGRLAGDVVAVPIDESFLDSPLRICVLARRVADAVQGHLFLRRDMLDARVYLGCLTDRRGVIELLEIWVQSTDGHVDAVRSWTTVCPTTNRALDQRWLRLHGTAVADTPGSVWTTGFEDSHPRPTYLDVDAGRPIHPPGWSLCVDDEPLTTAGLPAYSTTVHRYLHDGRRFVPLTAGAPTNETTTRDLFDGPPPVPFNPAAGLLMVRPVANLRFREFVDVLGGKPFDGSVYGKTKLRLPTTGGLSRRSNPMLSPVDRVTPARLVETFFLKLGLFVGMVDAAAKASAASGRPLLTLQPNSFAVQVDDVSPHLPALWQTRVQLLDTGDAVPIELPQGDTSDRFTLPGPRVVTSIYQPAMVARGPQRGFGQLFLSGLTETPAGKVFDGMLTVVDPVRPTTRDVLRIRVPVPGRRVDLFAKLSPEGNPSPGMLRFRSVTDDRSEGDGPLIEPLIGVPLQEVAFDFFPLFGTGVDAYSLSVLGVEIMLTATDAQGHAERVRDLLVLSSRCREIYSPQVSLVDRIAAVFRDRPESVKGLGPHLMLQAAADPATALRSVTPELWFEILAVLMKLLPGQGRDSLLAHFGDTIDNRPAGVYDTVLPDLLMLSRKARSLLLGDWGLNRQVGAILDEIRRPMKKVSSP